MKMDRLGVHFALFPSHQNGELAIGAQEHDAGSSPAAETHEAVQKRAVHGVRRRTRWLLATVIVVGLLYAAFPVLVSYGGSLAAARLGVQVLEVGTGYPGLQGVRVHALEVVGGSYRLVGHDGWLGYSAGGLLRGRFQALRFASAELALQGDRQGQTGDEASPGLSPERLARERLAAFDPAWLKDWSTLLPFASVEISALTLSVPDVHFLARGALTYGADGLELTLGGEAPEAASRLELSADLSPGGVVRARFSERDTAGPAFLEVASSLAEDSLGLEADIRFSGYVLDLVTQAVGLPPGKGTLQASLKSRVPWPVPDGLSWLDLETDGRADLSWRMADGSLDVEKLSGSFQVGAGTLEARVGGAVAALLQDVSLAARLPDDYPMTFDGQRLQAGPGPELNLSGGGLTAEGKVARLSIGLGEALQLEMAGDFSAAASGVKADGALAVEVARTAPDRVQGSASFQGTAAADRVLVRGRIAADVGLAGGRVEIAGQGQAGALGELTFTAGHDLAAGAGRLEVQGAGDLQAPLLASVIRNWRDPYDLDAGQLGYQLGLSWGASGVSNVRGVIGLTNVSAHYDNYQARGINGEFALRQAGDGWMFPETPVTVASVNLGLVARDLSAFVAWTGREVQVRGASAALLGGGITAAPFSYYPATGYGAVDVRLVELSLADLLALEGDDIAGTGRLNGLIPLRLLGNVVTVEAGRVKAAPPGGTIRVADALRVSTSQPGLDFALRALQNFDYSMLEADVEYAESGDLQLAVRLQGRNPQVEGGRPIHYNLNISENVPVLLESLRLQDRVTRGVEKRMRN